jgi:pimeloyl-ACP methyl ester carboxylesterase
VGRAAIARGFADVFKQLGSSIDINFRFSSRASINGGTADAGYYRLIIGRGAGAQRYYGSFTTVVRDQKFVSDTSGHATEDDFEGAAGTVLFSANDELLSATYYDRHVGTYSDGRCNIVITRSMRRLFALDECTGQWRALTRVDGKIFTAGDQVLDSKPSTRFSFELGEKARLTRDGTTKQVFSRTINVRTQAVTFGQSPKLAGILYLPTGTASKLAGVVMVHGSGEQDRHGYASIIALMAQRLARSGVAVLAYDKRGVGASEGNWNTAGFEALAADANAAMTYLRTRPEIDPSRVGLAGSSQAGWVVAKAIDAGGDPAFTLLVGAAGSAVTVLEQNLYNTNVRMKCAGIGEAEVALALKQQSAFFAARKDSSKSLALAGTSARAMLNPRLRDWLFPSTIAASAEPQWYDVLQPDFDPVPIWRKYRGKSYFLFSDQDDSTPSSVAIRKVQSYPTATVKLLTGAQHLGLNATTLCNGELEQAKQFHPEFFETLSGWGKLL